MNSQPAAARVAVAARPRVQTADLLQRILQQLRPQGVLWVSSDVPEWILHRPGLRVVVSNTPKPPMADAGLFWLEHDLTWLDVETIDDLREALGGRVAEIEFAWIDGHHALHVVLSHVRSALSLNPTMTLAFDDVVPPDMEMAGEHWGASDWWVGEVWRLFAWLRRFSSDLLVRAYDTASTGMGLISGLSPPAATLLDADQIRRSVSDLVSLENVLAALAPTSGRHVTDDLVAAGLRTHEGHPSAYSFVSLEDLRWDAAIEIADLATGGPWTRPPAESVLDLSGCAWPHRMDLPWTTELSTVAWASLPAGVIVRGTLLLELAERRLFAPRAARADMVAAFTAQIRGSRKQDEPGSHFFSGLDWLPGGEPVIDEVPIIDIEGDTLFVTPDEWDNWGVWLLQTLPALIHAERIGFDGHVLCRVVKPWQTAFIEAMAPRLAKKVLPHDVAYGYRVKGRLHVVAQELRNLATTAFEHDIYAEVVDRAMVQRPEPTPERMFLSRLSHSTRNPTYRALINEEALIAQLQPLGFHALEPEQLDVLSQVALFGRAREIIGLGGAAIFNVVFCRPGASILDIESSPTWVEGHANLFARSGLRYGIVFGQQLQEDTGPHARWRLPLAETVSQIRTFFGPPAS